MLASKSFTIMGEASEVTGILPATLRMTIEMVRNASMTRVTRSPNSGGKAKVKTEKEVTTRQGMMMLKRKKPGIRRMRI